MSKASAENIYETSNASLAAYLYQEGVKFLECKIASDSEFGKPKVILRFLDEKQVARDLEFIYMKSREKSHNEFYRWFLTQIHQKIREI